MFVQQNVMVSVRWTQPEHLNFDSGSNQRTHVIACKRLTRRWELRGDVRARKGRGPAATPLGCCSQHHGSQPHPGAHSAPATGQADERPSTGRGRIMHTIVQR